MPEWVTYSPNFISIEHRLSKTPKTLTNTKKKWYITITCEKCGEVVTKVYQKNTWSFICGRCSRGKKSTEEFIEECKALVGDRYEYDKVKYVKSNYKVQITCKRHGDFSVRPSDFLCGARCPVCSAIERKQTVSDRIKDIESTLYFIKFNSELYKVGVTMQEIKKRMCSCSYPYEEVWTLKGPYQEMCDLELFIKRTYYDYQLSVDSSFINGGVHEFYSKEIPLQEILNDYNSST